MLNKIDLELDGIKSICRKHSFDIDHFWLGVKFHLFKYEAIVRIAISPSNKLLDQHLYRFYVSKSQMQLQLIWMINNN